MFGDVQSGTHAEARGLAEEILADLELSRLPLVNVAMKCARLARITGNERALRWFQSEVGGYSNPIEPDLFQTALTIGRRVESTKPDEPPKVWTGSIGAIEANIETARAELASLTIPALSAGSSANPYSWTTPGDSITTAINTILLRRGQHLTQISNDTGIVVRIRSSIYRWALELYYVVRFGSGPVDAFQSAQSLVENNLGRISSDALQKFAAAQQRAISGAPEEWSQALTSLRRMLKDFADALYPPKEGEVDGHILDEEHYTNRLWQFAKERASGNQAAILAAEAQYIGHRIDALYDLVCKGTHAAVARQEVDMAVVHMYLLVADLLSLLTPEELIRLSQPSAAPSQGQTTDVAETAQSG